MSVSPRQAPYDEKKHPAVTLARTKEGDEISYRLNGGEWQTEVPQIKEVGSYSVGVRVKRAGDGEIPFYLTSVTVDSEITKRASQLVLADAIFYEKQAYTVTPTVQVGDGRLSWQWYRNQELTRKAAANPDIPGTYYVRAVMEESSTYLACESNVAKIIIREGSPGVINKNDDEGKKPPAANKVTVKKTSIRKLKSTKKKRLEVQWKKISSASGYEVYIARNKKFTRSKKVYAVKSGKTVRKQIRKLKSGKLYYVKVRACRVVKGKKYRGAFSGIRRVRVR